MTYDELMQSILTAQEEMLKHKIEANSVTLNGRRYGKLIEVCPPNMKPTIFGMAVKADYAMPDDYEFLVQYEPPHPQTNADRIRAMTDEELAEAFATACPEVDTVRRCCKYFAKGNLGCRACWLDWLWEEAVSDG
jgi:hypothetical protein